MSDRITQPAGGAGQAGGAVELRAGGPHNRRLFARLLEGQYLEVTDRGRVLIFDLVASAEAGRAVIWYAETGEA